MSNKDQITVTHTKCPVCKLSTCLANYVIEPNGDEGLWYRCNCGVTFQGEEPKQECIKEPVSDVNRILNGTRIYTDLIEESTYGRKFIPTDSAEIDKYLEDRGWVKMVSQEDKPDFIICDGVLEQQIDCIDFINTAYNLLNYKGILYIDTPNTDFLSRTNIINYHHWVSNENYILWNKRSLVRELEKVGFDIILTRDNPTTHFRKPDTVQVIAQK